MNTSRGSQQLPSQLLLEAFTVASASDVLLAAAAVYVGAAPRKVVVYTENRRVSVEPLGAAPQPAPVAGRVEEPPPPPGLVGRWLSPEEEQIVGALRQAGCWQTGKQVAAATGQSRSSSFIALLSNLARREIIESSTRSGYRLRQAVQQAG